jgi:hypothetical protein
MTMREESERRFQEMREDMEKRFQAVDRRFEAIDKRFEQIYDEIKRIRQDMHNTISAIGSRWGKVYSFDSQRGMFSGQKLSVEVLVILPFQSPRVVMEAMLLLVGLILEDGVIVVIVM